MSRALAFAVAAICVTSMDVVAQDFSVYTQVYDLDAKASNQPAGPIARSRTLFHAGKVYDVIHEAAEVTILEPAHRRITILNGDRNVVSVVDFDELKHLLKEAEERLAQRIVEVEEMPNVSRAKIETLRFQLRPVFESEFDPNKHRLRLLSKSVTYEVEGKISDHAEAVNTYLTYADWVCRLNYVLHPQPLFPSVRLELNEHLRRHKLLPTRVTLRANLDRPLNLRADHSVAWALDTLDRQSIHKWESLLRDPALQKVTLTEYQRIAFGQKTAKAK